MVAALKVTSIMRPLLKMFTHKHTRVVWAYHLVRNGVFRANKAIPNSQLINLQWMLQESANGPEEFLKLTPLFSSVVPLKTASTVVSGWGLLPEYQPLDKKDRTVNPRGILQYAKYSHHRPRFSPPILVKLFLRSTTFKIDHRTSMLVFVPHQRCLVALALNRTEPLQQTFHPTDDHSAHPMSCDP